jgi:hypothetical protein
MCGTPRTQEAPGPIYLRCLSEFGATKGILFTRSNDLMKLQRVTHEGLSPSLNPLDHPAWPTLTTAGDYKMAANRRDF